MPDTGEKLLAVVTELCEAGNYEAAFQALMAALHVADEAGDMDLLQRVSQIGANQAAAIDAMDPPHRLSTSAATNRGQTAVFRTLRIHVEAIRARHGRTGVK